MDAKHDPNPMAPVLQYATPQSPAPRPPADVIGFAAGCTIVVGGLMCGLAAVGLFAMAIRSVAVPSADPLGPALMFCGGVVLLALAILCWRALRYAQSHKRSTSQ